MATTGDHQQVSKSARYIRNGAGNGEETTHMPIHKTKLGRIVDHRPENVGPPPTCEVAIHRRCPGVRRQAKVGRDGACSYESGNRLACVEGPGRCWGASHGCHKGKGREEEVELHLDGVSLDKLVLGRVCNYCGTAAIYRVKRGWKV